MDATAGVKQEAPPARDGAPPTTSVPEVRRVPLSEVDVAGGDGGAAVESGGDGDDEQVERFYALLANIRALRDMYGGGGGSSRKRARGAEPPWRPAFRMEDFQVVADAGCEHDRKKERRDAVWRQHPGKASDEDEGEVVEEK